MATLVLPSSDPALPAGPAKKGLSPWQKWGMILIAPYVLVFLVFVVYPVGYGLWLARHPESYVNLVDDPIFARSVVNTLVFLIVGINFKMIVALFLSGFFVQARTWIKWLSLVFILPWAVPSIPTILSIRFMFNPEWGIINHFVFSLTGDDGPNWLNDPTLALSLAVLVHIWKSLPFWTVIFLSARRGIPRQLYEAASIDGAGPLQTFRYISLPMLAGIYLICTLLSMVFTMGDFTNVQLMTGGGPGDSTHVLATLAYRYTFRMGKIDWGMGVFATALPVTLLFIFVLIKKIR